MIRHEARTCTIRSCTTLTDDRIRKLYRSYVASNPATHEVRRKRGKSPRRIAYFLRNASAHLEASLLAGLFTAVGLIEDESARGPAQRSLEFGALFCDAFETYQCLWRSGRMSFEHAWFLLTALAFDKATSAWRWLRDHYLAVTFVSGAILIAMGVLILTGELTRLNIEAQKILNDLGLDFLYTT